MNDHLVPPKLSQVFTALALYIVAQIAIAPALMSVWLRLTTEHAGHLYLTQQQQITLAIVSLLTAALLIGFYSWVTASVNRVHLWRNRQTNLSPPLCQLTYGVLTWLWAYPCVFVVVTLASYLHPEESVDQVAVRLLKSAREDPPFLSLILLCMAVIGPIAEELLFRGYVQQWLRRYTAAPQAILATSLLFTLFHYSTSQGASNVELLSGLFVLSCFLGGLYERLGSLWAPIGLHVTFNSASALFLIYLH